MSQIRLKPDMMRVRANEYHNQSQQMNQIVQKLDQLIVQLQQEWDGKSAQAFQNQYEKLKPGLIQTVQLIDTVSNQLVQTANAIEALDHEIASKLQ